MLRASDDDDDDDGGGGGDDDADDGDADNDDDDGHNHHNDGDDNNRYRPLRDVLMWNTVYTHPLHVYTPVTRVRSACACVRADVR